MFIARSDGCREKCIHKSRVSKCCLSSRLIFQRSKKARIRDHVQFLYRETINLIFEKLSHGVSFSDRPMFIARSDGCREKCIHKSRVSKCCLSSRLIFLSKKTRNCFFEKLYAIHFSPNLSSRRALDPCFFYNRKVFAFYV